jgi:anti-anti-sigma factor
LNHLTVHEQESVSVIRLTDRKLDATSSRNAWRELKAFVQPGARLAIDCSALACLDAAGIALVVRSVQAAERCGASLRLFNLGPEPQTIAEMTRLHVIVSILNSEAEAMRSLGCETQSAAVSEPVARSESSRPMTKAATA